MVPPILRRSTMLSPKPLTVGAVPLCALLLMPSAAAAPNVKHAFVLRKANGLEKLFRDSFKDEWHRKGAYTSIDVYAPLRCHSSLKESRNSFSSPFALRSTNACLTFGAAAAEGIRRRAQRGTAPTVRGFGESIVERRRIGGTMVSPGGSMR